MPLAFPACHKPATGLPLTHTVMHHNRGLILKLGRSVLTRILMLRALWSV